MSKKDKQFLPALAWFIVSNILFFMPGNDLPVHPFLEKILFDKWVHVGLFAGMTFLTAYPFVRRGNYSKKLLIKISICYALFGVLVEYLQKYFATNRSFDVGDIIADTIGCILGIVAVHTLAPRLVEKNKPL